MICELKVEFNRDFVKVSSNRIIIGIKSKPIKGEANREIIKKLARHFGVSSMLVQIKSGQKSRQKIVEIREPGI